ncbi:MAG: SDR family NAD(P)-dependent oxidoreductase [bacterium]|nr:SDR family NAD(P)-dependent oxidoreductase [bacterium]
MQLNNNKILITGGGTGIGLGLAERFLQEGNDVIIIGRRNETLEAAKAKHPQLIIHACDIENESGRIDLFHWIQEQHPDTNVLINNAGIQNWMDVSDIDFYERAKQELAINIEAPLHLISLFLKAETLTTIMNVSSGLSYVPLAKVPVYSATKSFIRSFTTSIQKTLGNTIEVIEIIPPALNTDLGGVGLHDSYPPVSEFITSIFEQLKEGKNKLTFGMSDMMAKASSTDLENVFNRMNP